MKENLSINDCFLESVNKIVGRNLDNEDFTVEQLAKDAGLCRSMLHRRLIKLTGKSASEIITETRLLKAKELLENNVATVSEIAYKTGFNSTTYFHKVFKKRYSVTPGEIRKRAVKHSHLGSATNRYKLITRKLSSKYWLIIMIIIFKLIVGFIAGSFLFMKNQSDEKSIVVLPLKNLSSDEEYQYIAYGLAEDILNNLFYISDLRVLSHTTSQSYKDTKLSVGKIGRKVNAKYILEGSIRRYDDDVRISIQLIDSHFDNHIWSANYDCKLNDVLGVQSDIASQIAHKINAVITEAEIIQIKKITDKNAEAYDD